MSQLELCLLTRVIDDGDFHSLEKARIDESFFQTPEAQQIYRFLKNTFHGSDTGGMVPSRSMVSLQFPGFYYHPASDPVPILAHQLRKDKIALDLKILAQTLMDQADNDPMSALSTLRVQSSAISALQEGGQDLSMANTYQLLKDQYELVQESGGVIGIPFPWLPLNEATQGMQAGNFGVIFGRPKSMKTWTTIYMACHAYTHSRKRVLFYTREMAPKQVAGRMAACLAKVDYHKYLNGRLQPEVKAHLFNILQELMDDEKAHDTHAGRQPFLLVTTDRGGSGSGAGGVGWLQAKIRELKPDIVFVDGMYLMKDDRTNQRSIDWKQVAHISQDLKGTAQEFDIPVIGVTQANRASDKSKGEDLTELAFSDSLGMDADFVLRVNRSVKIDENTKQKKTEVLINAPGLREGVFDGIVIKGEPASDFSYLRTIVSTDEDKKEEYAEKQKKGPAFSRSFAPPKPGLPKR